MTTARPFSWTVRFTVAPVWVQDGFSICNERALSMLRSEVSGSATETELTAVVLEAPSPLQIANIQGYHKDHPGGGKVVRELIAGCPDSGAIRRALLASRKLLDSVAYVAKEGDTVAVLEKIDVALDAIDARRGTPVEIEDK